MATSVFIEMEGTMIELENELTTQAVLDQTKFETISIAYQKGSKNLWDAMRNFKLSCNICSRRGLQLKCDTCQILAANDLYIAIKTDLKYLKS